MALWPRLFGRDAPTPPPTAAPRRPRVFVSYAHQPPDLAALVREFAQYLTRCGFDVWFDELDIHAGDAWRRAIVDGLRTTDWTLAFLSAHAMRTGSVCLDEIALSMHQRPGSLVTVLLEPAQDVPVPVSIAEVQWLDLSGWRAAQAQGRRAWHAWRDARFAAIRALLSDHRAQQATGEIAELAARLPLLSQASLVGRLVDRFAGRAWLADSVNDWRLNRPAERMLLLTGAAGIGKSAFAAWLTHHARANVIGLTISRADDPPSRAPANVLRTLAFQIATRLPDYRRRLLDLLAQRDPDNRPVHDVHAMEPVPLFRLLLANPLRLIDGGRMRDRLLLIVDGLDETLEADRCPLADLFAQHAAELPDWMGVLLTSRPHHEVERALSQLLPLRIETHAASNIADIRDYAERWLDGLDPPVPDRAATLQRLIEAADGSFQYLTVLRQEVEQDRVSLREPAALPRGLVGLYRVWMDRQFPDRAAYDEWRALLAVLCAAHGPVPEAFLAELLGWDPQRKAHMLEQIEGLFERRDGAVAPCHASLRAWLTTEEAARSDFWVQVAHGQRLLTDTLWERFVAWLDATDAPLDRFLVAELPAQLAQEDAVALRDRLAAAGPWPRLAEHLRAIVAGLKAGLAWQAALAWLGLIDRCCVANGDEALSLRLAMLNERGDTLMLLGDSENAHAAYGNAHEIALAQAARDPNNAGWQRDLSVSYEKVGNVQVALGKLAEALQSYRADLVIAERLARADPNNAGWQHDLSVSYEKVGDVQVAQGNLAEALQSYRADLAIAERLVKADPNNAGWQRELSVAYEKVGNVQVAQGNLAEALQSYRASLVIVERLANADPNNTGWQYDLGISNERIGDVQVAQSKLAEALTSYRTKFTIIERLAKADPSNAGWQRDLAVSHDKVGNVQVALGDLNGALQFYRASLAIRERLGTMDPNNAGWQRDRWVSYNKVGDVQVAQGNLAEALQSYRADLAIAERLAKADPNNAGWQRGLSVSYQRMGNARRSQGDLPGALTAYQQALAICRGLVARNPEVTNWQLGVANNLQYVGDIMQRQGDLAGALAAFRHALPIREWLSARDASNVSHAREPVYTHGRIAEVLLRLGDSAAAHQSAQTAVTLARDAHRRFPEDKGIAQNLRVAEALLEAIRRQAPLPAQVVGFAEPPVPPPAPPPDPRAGARAALDAGRPDQALDLLQAAPGDGRTRNLRAVCLLRLGQPEAARDMLHPALFPNGGAEPADGTADTWVLNHATAQFLAGDPRGCRRSLGWLKNPSRGASRLRDALATWERLPHQRGAPPPKPTLPYTPGEL